MRFIFRLQNYLNLKGKLEDQRKMEYGKALALVEAERQKKFRLQQERGQRLEEFSEKVRGTVDPQEFARYNLYIEILRVRIIEQDEVIKRAEIEAEKRRLALVEAMKERKTLETLREKELEEYKIEEKRAEQRMVDETVSFKYGAKKE